LVDNLIKHRYFNRGLYHLRQLYVLTHMTFLSAYCDTKKLLYTHI
jgi:hypothetical protein